MKPWIPPAFLTIWREVQMECVCDQNLRTRFLDFFRIERADGGACRDRDECRRLDFTVRRCYDAKPCAALFRLLEDFE